MMTLPRLLLVLFCLIAATVSAFSLVAAMTIEFRRSSSTSSTSMTYNYVGADSSFYTLLAAVNSGSTSSTSWSRVCYTLSYPNDATGDAICKMMGRNPTSMTRWSYSSSTSYGVSGLTCVTQSSNTTNFDQCSYDTTNTYCSRFLTLRCGSLNADNATHGTYIEGTPNMFIRRRWNRQLQVRQIFTTSWKNVGTSSSFQASVAGAANLCYWSIGATASTPWTFTSTLANPLDSTSGFALADVECDYSSQKALSTSACTYKSSTGYATTLAALPSTSAVAVTCPGEVDYNSVGVSIGGGYRMRLMGTSTSKRLEIMTAPSTFGMAICTQSFSSTTTFTPSANTIKTFCKWAGYGDYAYGYSSTGTASAGEIVMYNYVDCPAYSSSISDCVTRAPMVVADCSQYLTISCYYGSSNSNYSPSDDRPNAASWVVPVVWVAIIVIFLIVRKWNSSRTAVVPIAATTGTNYQNFNNNVNNNNNNATFSSTTSPTNNYNYNNQGSPQQIQYGADPYGHHQSPMMMPPMNPSPLQPPPVGYNYQPAQNWNAMPPPPPPPPTSPGANFAPTTQGMTTFDNVGHGDNVAPPPNGYSFMPAFGNYPPPPPPPAAY